MSTALKEVDNNREWIYSATDGGLEEESFNLNNDDTFSDTVYNDPDAEVLKTPRSLKELASEASVMNISNDSGYEGVNSGLKLRKNLEVNLTEEKKPMEKMEYRAEEEELNFLGSMLDILKMYVVVVSLLYMVYMSESTVGGELGGKKAAIQFYYDSQQQ